MVDIIEKKRDGLALSEEEINFFVNGFTKELIKQSMIDLDYNLY